MSCWHASMREDLNLLGENILKRLSAFTYLLRNHDFAVGLKETKMRLQLLPKFGIAGRAASSISAENTLLFANV